MLKSVIRIGAATLLAAVIAGAPAQLSAQSTNKSAAEKQGSVQKKDGEPTRQRKLPYAGNLTAIDKKARTFTVGKRAFEVVAETKFFRGDKAAVMADGVPGEYLTLSYVKSEDGKFIAQNVYFGGKKTEKGGQKKKDK